MSVLMHPNELGNHPKMAQRGHTNSGGQGKMVLMAVCAAQRSRCAWETMTLWNTKNDGPFFSPDKRIWKNTNSDGKGFYSSYSVRLISLQVSMTTVPTTI